MKTSKKDSDPKVRVIIPVYKPLEISKCKNCGKVIAEPKEFIRIVKEVTEWIYLK